MSDAYSAATGDMPDVSQLTPATGRVGAPASGTYGEKQALIDLERSFPAPSTPPAAGPSAPAGSSGPLPLPPPGGALPRSIAAPSTRPSEPMSTPLLPQTPVAETPSLQQRQKLEAIARDPTKRETTRLWAQAILDSLGDA